MSSPATESSPPKDIPPHLPSNEQWHFTDGGYLSPSYPHYEIRPTGTYWVIFQQAGKPGESAKGTPWTQISEPYSDIYEAIHAVKVASGEFQGFEAPLVAPKSPVQVEVTRYTVSILPELDPNWAFERIQVEYAGKGLWAVRTGPYCLSRRGEWVDEPFPSSRTDAWIVAHRFSQTEAIKRAQEMIQSDAHRRGAPPSSKDPSL